MMNGASLIDLFASLPPSTSADTFRLQVIGDDRYAAKSNSGEDCIVIVYRPGTILPRTGRETRGLKLEFHPEFQLLDPEGTPSSIVPAGVFRCLSPLLRHLFAIVAEGLLAQPDLTLPKAFVRYVTDWQNLLANQPSLSPAEQLGLWGELWVILSAPNPQWALDCWYGPDAKTFDFSADHGEMDVKTSLQGHRHHVSLDQVLPSPSNSGRFIYSLSVDEDPAGGSSLSELVTKVRAVAADSVEVERKLCAAGYRDDVTYQVRYTVRQDLLYAIDLVPRVHGVDDGVSQVRFVTDLSRVQPVSHELRQDLLTRLLGSTAAAT
jgi:hypothetical protein